MQKYILKITRFKQLRKNLMKTVEDIVKAFDIKSTGVLMLINSSKDIEVALESKWQSDGDYRVHIGDMEREIESYKVNSHNQILFYNSETKQITVLALEHCESEHSYRYEGDVIAYFQNDRNYCKAIKREDTGVICVTLSIAATRKKEASITETEYPNTEEGESKAIEEFEKHFFSISSK